MIDKLKVIHYCLQMYLKILEINELDPAHFLSAPGLAWQACFKQTEVKLGLLTDIDMFLMVEKGTMGRICHSIHRHAKANNKYMKNYDKNKESSYLMYLNVNMPRELPFKDFKWKKMYLNLMKIS